MPPIPPRPVSGRYVGRGGDFEVELRIDVDGGRPMNHVSADYFQLDGDERVYSGSMCVDDPVIVSTRTLLTITGVGRSSWETAANNVRVTIPRELSGRPGTTATLSHFTASGEVRALFDCNYQAASFRVALLEEDTEQGVSRFRSYETGSLPSACSPRTLTVAAAFEDAGIEIQRTRAPGVIETGDVAANASWSDAELHAAMLKHFSSFSDAPQWAIWLLHARLHDRDRGSAQPRLYGLMFDQRGTQRQGCALFYQGMGGASPQQRRVQLFTCIHELGHSFNLLHSFQKSLAIPPVPDRPGSATWMAYPDLFPGGAAAFWPRFAFEFDDPEVAHLRHAFRADVIMGGNPFTAGAAFEQDADMGADLQEESGLQLKLSAPRELPFGVPVTVDFELSGTTREGRRAPSVIGPRPGNVDVEIRKPDGTALVFEPLLRHCRVDDVIVLRASDPPVRDSAFIHYGKDGFPFDWPGGYEVRARCTVPDGAFVWSNTVRIDVRPPRTRADYLAAELAFGDELGILMSLVGSDAPELRRGREAMQSIVERFPKHPVASIPRLIHATNEAREFKAVQLDGSVRVRESRPLAAAASVHQMPGLEAMLRAAVTATSQATLSPAVAESLGRVHKRAADRVLQPYVRSRINEIFAVIPQIIASMPPPRGPTPRLR